MANLDMAGIITRVCTSLKSKFSKVTFEQAVTSGTKLGTITIDGEGHDIYSDLPAVTTADYGKFLVVSSGGKWYPAEVPNANGEHF